MLLLLFLIVANLFGVGMIVPQITRLHRTKVAEGVSAPWVGVGMAMNFWWLNYGIQGQLWGLVPVSMGALIVYAVVAVQLRALTGSRVLRPIALSALGTSLALLTALGVAGWTAVGLTLGLAYGPQFAPAVFNALRSSSTAGVSRATWTMASVEAVIWVIYGIAVADPALIIGGVGGTLMALVILVRLWIGELRRVLPNELEVAFYGRGGLVEGEVVSEAVVRAAVG